MTFEQAVHDTIMAVLSTTACPVVGFDSSTGSAFVGMNVDEGTTILPTQAETNAVQYVMEQAPERLTTEYKGNIAHVVWRAHVVYPKQVSVEALLESFSRAVEADGAQRRFDLRLVAAEVEAPPRNAPSSGTFLVLTIEAHPVPAP